MVSIILSESVREHHEGLQSFLTIKRTDAQRRNARPFRFRHSQSLARRGTVEPGERSLDNPAFGQHHEARIGPFDDLDIDCSQAHFSPRWNCGP